MANQTIKTNDLKEFTSIIAELVKQGLTFESFTDDYNNCSSKYLIELTGGY